MTTNLSTDRAAVFPGNRPNQTSVHRPSKSVSQTAATRPWSTEQIPGVQSPGFLRSVVTHLTEMPTLVMDFARGILGSNVYGAGPKQMRRLVRENLSPMAEVRPIRSVAVYCGGSEGRSADYVLAAQRLGYLLAQQKLEVVYGGSNGGLMGAVAGSVMANHGNVVGVIPRAGVMFSPGGRELPAQNSQTVWFTNNKQDRRTLMAEMSDAFIALPGGLGTMEELFEVLCWDQNTRANKAIGLLNTRDFYTPLMTFLKRSVREGFMSRIDLESICIADTPEKLLKELAAEHVRRHTVWPKTVPLV